MLKTNSKQVKTRIYNDFMEYANAYASGEVFNSSVLYTIVDDIEAAVYGLRLPSYQDAFEYFVMSSGLLSLYYDEQRAYLADVLQETPEEANRYDNDKVTHTYCALFYRAFLEACKRYDVNPYYSL